MDLFIWLFTFLGWLIFHLSSLKKFNSATPGLTIGMSVKAYFINDFFGFMISVIAMVVFATLITFGMADILSSILGIPKEYQSDRLQILIAFVTGINIQFVINFFTKTNPMDTRTLPAEIKKDINDN